MGLIFSLILLLGQVPVFSHLGVNDGVAHSDVLDIDQDSQGFLWIATHNGLQRYDGDVLRTFRHTPGDSVGLPGNRIKTICVDSRDRIWAYIHGSGFGYFNGESERFFRMELPGLGTATISDIEEDKSGDIWVATYGEGVFKIENTGIRHYLAEESALAQNDIRDLSRTVSGDIISLSASGIPQRFSSDSIVDLGIDPSLKIQRILPVGEGKYLLCDRDRLYVWGNGKVESVARRKLKFFPSDIISENGNAWISGSAGCEIFDLASGESEVLSVTSPEDIPKEKRLANNRANCLFADRSGMVWVGTSGGGLSFYKPFRHDFRLSPKEGLPNKYISAFAEGKGGKVWVGTRTGLALFDKEKGRFENIDYLTSRISALSKAHISDLLYLPKRNTLWVSSRNLGVFVLAFSEDGKALESDKRILEGRNIIGLCWTENGKVWLTGYTSGVYLADPSGEGLEPLDRKTLPSLALNYCYADSLSGKVWFSTRDKGIFAINAKTRELTDFYGKADGLGADYCWPIVKTAKDTLWVGTIGGGLTRLVFGKSGKPNYKIYHSGNTPEMEDNDIESLAFGKGELWAGGRGLLRFGADGNLIRKYSRKDGLQSESFKIGASLACSDGWFFFGGSEGFNYFHPLDFSENTALPYVGISAIKTDNKQVFPDSVGSYHISPNSRLDIDLKGMCFSDGNRCGIEYRFFGKGDTTWTDLPYKATSFSLRSLDSEITKIQFRAVKRNGVVGPMNSVRLTIDDSPFLVEHRVVIVIFSLIGIVVFIFLFWNKKEAEEYRDQEKAIGLESASRDSDLLDKVRGIALRNVSEGEFGVAQLAEAMAMSQSSLYKKVKAESGQTVVELIRNIRLEKAGEMLTVTALPVGEIANAVGFSDVKYFGRCFRKRFGQSPSEYRQERRRASAK
ncbi:hypothetical protein FUAX_23670 [Fulvitalea axinellae]|uniref:HTH araC/xylS-type domain-containing protein n=1 Tax=Fulvitalea axinellae TaxID=1182444 RepID=A0AAU9CKV2_9BACT|nr:hypothetical protein FUAX_23670 [Fulvitalea axinellae]